MIPDGSASARERRGQSMAPKGSGGSFLPRRVGAGTGGGADDVQHTRRHLRATSSRERNTRRAISFHEKDKIDEKVVQPRSPDVALNEHRNKKTSRLNSSERCPPLAHG